jgi:hypothetical protein
MILTDTVTFLVGAAILTRIPHVPPTRTAKKAVDEDRPKERRWVALRDLHYLGFTIASSLASLQYFVLVTGVPLWIVLHTTAPRWLAAIVLFFEAALVAVCQVPVSRSIDGPRSAARMLAFSGPLFLVAWILIALASGPDAWLAVTLLFAGVVIHSLAEIWQAAGTFELSFALARTEAQGQYQGVFGMGLHLVEAVAPVVVIAMCVTWGKPGWIVLAVVVTVASFLCALVERGWSRATAETAPVVG